MDGERRSLVASRERPRPAHSLTFENASSVSTCHPTAAFICAACLASVDAAVHVLGSQLCGDCYSAWSLEVEHAKRAALQRRFLKPIFDRRFGDVVPEASPRDPGEERWMDLEGALLDAIGWLTEIARGAECGRQPDPAAVTQRRDELLELADELQDERHARELCPGLGECAACDVEAEERAGSNPA